MKRVKSESIPVSEYCPGRSWVAAASEEIFWESGLVRHTCLSRSSLLGVVGCPWLEDGTITLATKIRNNEHGLTANGFICTANARPGSNAVSDAQSNSNRAWPRTSR